MAGRIRSIKPELLEDEKIASLSDAAWRLFVASWLLSDDYGRFRAGAQYLAAQVWQDTTKTDLAQTALDELHRLGRFRLYRVDGELYGVIPTWKRHQRVDNAGKPRVPVPTLGSFIEPDAGPGYSEGTPRGESPRVAARPPTDDHRPTTTDQDHTNVDCHAPESDDSGYLSDLLSFEDFDRYPTPAPPEASAAAQPDAPPVADDTSADPAKADLAQASDQPERPPSLPQPEPTDRADIIEVYQTYLEGWKATINGSRPPRLDARRKRLISARLRQFSLDELKAACRGIWASNFNVTGGYYSLDLVMRDADHVERFMEMAEPTRQQDAERVRAFFGRKWSKKTGEAFAPADADMAPAWSLWQNARRISSGPGAPNEERCIRHWVDQYLNDNDRKLSDARWPLSWLPARIGSYGLPGQTRATREVAEAIVSPPAPPMALAAQADVAGRISQSLRQPPASGKFPARPSAQPRETAA